MKWKIPLFQPNIGKEELDAIQRPVKNQWLTMGEEVQRVEEFLQKQLNVKHVFLVSNGTAALHLAAVALGLGPGDEVICPTLTFVASASAFRAVGSRVIFCESAGEHNLTLDPADLERRITPKTRAIVCVHYAGFPCNMERIAAVAARHDLRIVEDCAHAVFTKSGPAYLGTVGDIGCYSFFSNKNITCGEGGAITTNDDHLAENIRLLRSHGMTTLTLDRHKGRAYSYDVVMPGFNYRLDEIHAALLSAQLVRLPHLLEKRRGVFLAYKSLLQSAHVTLPFSDYPCHPDWNETAVHILPVLLPEGCDRSQVMESMKKAGIQTSIHYPCVHTFNAYQDSAQSLPLTESLSARLLTLPFFPDLSPKQCGKVIQILMQAIPASTHRS